MSVTQGADDIGSFNLTPNSGRKWCKHCGGHLFAKHPGMGLTDVCAALLPRSLFKWAIHVNYVEAVLPMRDGLPKFEDFPKEVGGSRETMPE